MLAAVHKVHGQGHALSHRIMATHRWPMVIWAVVLQRTLGAERSTGGHGNRNRIRVPTSRKVFWNGQDVHTLHSAITILWLAKLCSRCSPLMTQIAPHAHGVANALWLNAISVRDTNGIEFCCQFNRIRRHKSTSSWLGNPMREMEIHQKLWNAKGLQDNPHTRKPLTLRCSQ